MPMLCLKLNKCLSLQQGGQSSWQGSSRTTKVHFLLLVAPLVGDTGLPKARIPLCHKWAFSMPSTCICVPSTGEKFGKIVGTKLKRNTSIPSMLYFLTGLASLGASCLNCQRLVSINIWPRKATMWFTLYCLIKPKRDISISRGQDGLMVEVTDLTLKPLFSYCLSDLLKASKHLICCLLSFSFACL